MTGRPRWSTTTAGAERWLWRYHQADAGAPTLLCLAHAGGAASFFRPVSAKLSPAVDVVAVQYPGRQDRRSEPAIESITGLADALAPIVRPLADRPRLALFGHSMGAVVAYEVARRLVSAGAPPLHRLFVSGQPAPSRLRVSSVHRRDDAGVLAEVRSLGGTETALLDDPGIQELVLPALRADYKAVETYVEEPGPPLDCPITVLIGDSDPQVTDEEARDWARHTTGPFELVRFPGGHFYLREQADAVIGVIAASLARG